MIRISALFCVVFLFSFGISSEATAQGTQVAFGEAPQNTDLPVEVTSEALDVNQETGEALFTGDVVVAQGAMRMTAPKVLVFYNEAASAIERMEATGGVTLVSGPDEAEAERADYSVADGMIVMTGDVLLKQGFSAVAGDQLDVQLNDGTARMTGRVRTVLQTGDGE